MYMTAVYISISYFFIVLFSLLILLLFIIIPLSFGCCDEEISPFVGQIKEFWFWSESADKTLHHSLLLKQPSLSF